MKLAIGIAVVALSSTIGAAARGQDVTQSAVAAVCQADLPARHEFPSAPQKAMANGVRSDDGPQGASSKTIPVGDQPAAATNSPPAVNQSVSTPCDDRLAECCRPLCCNPCPCVYLDVEAVFMDRDPRLARQPIIVDPNTGTTFLSTSDLDFNFDPGLRATVGMRLGCGQAVEFSYFGLFQGSASAVATSPDAGAFLTFPNNLFGNVFVGMDSAAVFYSSGLNSFEFNLPCCCGCCQECQDGCDCGDRGGCGEAVCQSITWFAGFRYLNLHERLDITAERTVSGAVENGVYDIRTDNNLYGAQLGARLRRSQGRLGWELTGKGGLFGNSAQESQSVTDFPNFPLRPNVSRSGGEVAFVGETNLSVFYRLTNVWDVRAGYSVMWIEGLALAPDQLDFDFATSPSGNQLHNGGGMFLHGVNFGLEARW